MLREGAEYRALRGVKVALRPVTPADEPFLWDMLYLAAHLADEDARSSIMRTDPSLARYVEGWGRAHDVGFVAVDVDSNERIGAVWMRLLTGDDRGAGYVDDATPELAIAVLPAHRRRGIGAKLLQALIEQARRSYSAVSLSTRATNPAIRMYRRLGFEVVPGSETKNRAGGLLFTMTLTLTAPRTDAT